MNQERGLIAWMAYNPVAANLLMLMIMLGGLLGLNGLTREVFPTFPSESLTVTVPYPGSSPEEVEEGILLKIEEAIQDIVGIRKIYALAEEGVGVVTVELDPGTSLEKVLGQVKMRIDGIASFPVDAEEPIVEEILSLTRAMRITLSGALDENERQQLADQIRDEILSLHGITQVEIVGTRDYEISIEVSDSALRQYGLRFDTVVNALRSQSRDLPGGTLRTRDQAITLRSIGQAHTGADFAGLVLLQRADGTRITVADVATVSDGFSDQPMLSRMNSRDSVTLMVNRIDQQNILEMAAQLHRYVASKQADLPPGVELVAWSDRSETLTGRIDLLLRNAAQSAVLVFLTLALFLDLSLAFWVIAGIPFAVLGTFLVLHGLDTGVSINVVSLFGFILVLGILVDDGIVTAESAYTELERENQGVDSIIRGVRKVAVATVFGTLTTVIAFTPFLFLEEGFARFLWQISPVVILSLFFSLLETKLILPAHLRHQKIVRYNDSVVLSPLLHRIQKVRAWFARQLKDFSENQYRSLLELAIRERYLTIATFIGVLIIVIALLPAGVLRFVFFPNVPSDFIVVDLQMPEGTSYLKTHEYARQIEQAVWAMSSRYEKEAGNGVPAIRQMLVLSEKDNQAVFTLELIPSTERDMTSVELADWLRQSIGTLSGIRSLFIDASAGPQSMPLDVELAGSNLDNLRLATEQLKKALQNFDGVFDVRDTFNAGGSELDIRITPEGTALGLGQVELARQVRQAFFGAEVQRLQRGRHEVRVYVRFPRVDRTTPQSLRAMWIDLPDGRKVPLAVVAEIQERIGVSTINRLNRQRVVNIQANLDKATIEPGQVIATLEQTVIPELLASYPGVTYRFAGEAEQQAKTTQTLWTALAVVLLLIYAALAIPLRSYGQPLVIMAVIPFAVVGAFLGHLILGKEINVLSIVGIIGLIGISVNDSLVLVDYINHKVSEGMPLRDAAHSAGIRRFRAVILTSATTFMGLLPIQLERSIQAQFVKPMAISIAFGVLFSTFVTLLLVPILFHVIEDWRGWCRRIKNYQTP